MMLRYSFGLEEAANAIENAVAATLDNGVVTADLAGGGESVPTAAMGDAIVAAL